jgi:hypothetical protein
MNFRNLFKKKTPEFKFHEVLNLENHSLITYKIIDAKMDNHKRSTRKGKLFN